MRIFERLTLFTALAFVTNPYSNSFVQDLLHDSIAVFMIIGTNYEGIRLHQMPMVSSFVLQ